MPKLYSGISSDTVYCIKGMDNVDPVNHVVVSADSPIRFVVVENGRAFEMARELILMGLFPTEKKIPFIKLMRTGFPGTLGQLKHTVDAAYESLGIKVHDWKYTADCSHSGKTAGLSANFCADCGKKMF